jgi:sugar lactone lactonase YvrE
MFPSRVKIQPAAVTADILGESPFWDWRSGHLYWVDLRRPSLNRLAPASGLVETWPMPELIGSVVGRRAGGLVVALQSGLHAFSPETGALTPLLALEADLPEHRLNDAKCDRSGRLWIGSMWDFGHHPTGHLYRIEADLSAYVVRSGITVPNAIAFSPDQSRLYFTDTRRGAVEWTALGPDGEIACWQTLLAAEALPGAPDGATVDADGCLWHARFGGGLMARITPAGDIDRIVELPVSRPTSCAFGGPDLDVLFVTTARQGLDPAALAAEPLAGSLLALDVDVRGLPEPLFAG